MKKMSKGMLMTALICGAVYLVGSTPVYANELQEFALDEYVVTAARTETKLVDTPANISVVDAQTIEERHYQDVSEVLKDVPGANVLDSGTGAFEKKIMLNGDERVLVLVDGRRVNIEMGTMSRSGYDMNQLPDVGLIERIEVLKGAGGALYGSDAVGGVVNIITKKADRSFGKVSVAMGSMGVEDYNAMYSFKQGKTGVNVAASKYEQDYYKYRDAKTDTTKRWPADSRFKDEKVSLKIAQEITADTNLSVGYDYSKFEGVNPYNLNNPQPSFVTKETENIYAQYDWILNNSDAGYIRYYHNEFKYYNQGGMEESTDGFDIQQAVNTSENNKLVLGVSYRTSDAYNETSFTQEESVDNIAVFANNTWEFAPNWSLNIGARYDKHSEAGSESTLSAGLNRKFDNDSHAYINWGQVFKAPTVDDLYYFSPPGSYEWEGETHYYPASSGNPNLKAETGDTWTVGYATKLNSGTLINISYFESDIKDAIYWDWSGSNTIVYNVDNQERRGIELSVSQKLNSSVDLEASYTYVRTKNSINGSQMDRDLNYIPNMYRLGIRYHDGKWNADTFLRIGSGASQDRYLDSSYLTLDCAVTYKANNNLNLYVKGYNLFNESYAEQGGHNGINYNFPAQSRRFIVGAEYKF